MFKLKIMSSVENNVNNSKDMDKMLNDKIFQYYYKKTFNGSRDYFCFKLLSTESQISFLIKLFLFVSSNTSSTSSHNITFENKDQSPQCVLDSALAESIKSKLDEIISRHKLPSIDSYYKFDNENNNTAQNEEEKSLENNNTNDAIQHNISYNVSEINENDNTSAILQITNNHYKTLYAKISYDPELFTDTFTISDMKAENKEKFEMYNEITIDYQIQNLISVKNDIVIEDSSNDVNNLKRTIKHPQCDKFYVQNYKQLSDPNKKCYITKSINQLLSSNKYNMTPFTTNDDQSSFYSVFKKGIYVGDNEKTFHKTFQKKKGIVLNDMVLINQSISDESKFQLKSFNKSDLVDRLFQCPANKYITLDAVEAAKIGNVIIELMRSENEMEKAIEEKKGELERLLTQLNEQRNKTYDTELQLNSLKKEFENKKLIVDKYIDNLNEKIENAKGIFDINNKDIISDDNYEIDDKTHDEILNQINTNLQFLQSS